MSNTVVTEEMISAVAWSPSHQEGVPWGMLLNDEQIGNILNIGLANAPAALQSAADTPAPQTPKSSVSDDKVKAYKARYEKYLSDVLSGAIAVEGDVSFEATRAALTDIGIPMSISPWSGWDQSRLPWSEAKHKDAVCYAVFGETWSMEDAHTLISFIERTWPRSGEVNP